MFLRRALPALLVAVVVAGLSAPALATGVVFETGTFENVLNKARTENKRVMVEVWASWCAPCKVQAKEVFDTDAGAALTEGLLAWKVDFDAPEQRARMKRWNVLRLPTVLFLRPDGTEIDRIEGYEGKATWLSRARRAADGHDPTEQLRKTLATLKDPSTPRAQALRVELGHALLVRGDTGAGVGLLEQAIAGDPPDATRSEAGPGDEALFHLGRYWSRVMNDYTKGGAVWERLLARAPEGPYAPTAVWWIADAKEQLGDPAAADAQVARFVAAGPSADRLGLAVEWMEKSRRPLPTVRQQIGRAHLSREVRQDLLHRYDAVAGEGRGAEQGR
jgi:thiol-disulfide isomerase/thioredoxin